jgi:hypothetical protein
MPPQFEAVEGRFVNSVGSSTTIRHSVNTGAPLQPPHLPERFGAIPNAGQGADRLLAEARAARVGRCTVVDYLRFAVVSVYLTGVLAWLVASRQIRPNFSVRRTLRAFLFRQRKPTPLVEIAPDEGHCYRAAVDPDLLSDAESVSRLRLYEDGLPLTYAHADHAAIRRDGRGKYSHWQGAIYFSTRDNTDPRSNGRRYVYKEV